MLIYLFALEKYGGARYGANIARAGVLYVPTRDVTLKASRNATDDEIEKKRGRELRRNGLILNDPFIIEAMEKGDIKKYIPVKFNKDGAAAGDSLIDADQFALLSKHVDRKLRLAMDDILGGGIECIPYYRSENDNACLYCDYNAVCGFDEDTGDRRRFAGKQKADEIWKAMVREG